MLIDQVTAGEDLLDGELRRLYGGPLSIPPACVYANFVMSVDGVVALDPPGAGSGPAISGRNEGDRFLMGLLRACADAVLIGAGTLRADPGHLWTAGHIHPPSKDLYSALRRRLDLPPEPTLVVASSSGRLDAGEGVLEKATVITTDAGAGRLRGTLPSSARLISLGLEPPSPPQLVSVLRRLGLRRVLSEAGPHLFGSLVRDAVVDELFLTLSPVLAGRATGRHRMSLIEGAQFLPGDGREARLLSSRRLGSHLFLRYGLGRG